MERKGCQSNVAKVMCNLRKKIEWDSRKPTYIKTVLGMGYKFVFAEMKEETGLTITNLRLCGVEHFPIDEGRYIVFLFEATQYEGELCSSDEGRMYWIKTEELDKVHLVNDFYDLIDVMLDENLSEFQYVFENKKWNIIKK